jgi:CHAT domain-containing protein/tetratricopeptide (TPR) repeat protein
MWFRAPTLARKQGWLHERWGNITFPQLSVTIRLVGSARTIMELDWNGGFSRCGTAAVRRHAIGLEDAAVDLIRRALVLLGALAGMAGMLASQCLPLLPGRTVAAVISAKRASCFSFRLPAGQATQLAIEQPVDFEFRTTLDGVEQARIDSFSLGSDTLTLTTAGEYRITIRQVGGPATAAVPFAVSRWLLPLEEARRWERAEASATQSKLKATPENLSESLRLWQEVGNAKAVARTHLERGANLLNAGEMRQARDEFEQTREMCLEVKENACALEAANNSGWAASQLGDFPQAAERLEQAADGWRSTGNKLFLGRTLSNLGLLYRRTGDYNRAIHFYGEARAALGSLDMVSLGRVLNNLGICYTYLSEYGRARSHLEAALAIYAHHKSPADAVRTRINLGRTLMLRGELPEAQRTLEEALAAAEDLKDRAARADSLSNLGQTFLKQGAFDRAEVQLTESWKIYSELGDRRGQAATRHHLGLILRARGDLDKAQEYLSYAAKTRRETGLRDDAADSLYALADLQREKKNLPAARELAEQALAMLESVRKQIPSPALRAAFYSSKRRFFDLLVEIAMQPENLNRAADGLLATEQGKGRAILDLLTEGPMLRQLPAAPLARRLSLQRRIDLLSSRLSSAPVERQDEIRRELDLLIAEDAELEAQVRQVVVDENLAEPLHSIQELQDKALQGSTALLEYHLGEKGGHLWLVTKNAITVFPLPARSDVEKSANRTVDLFQDLDGRQKSASRQADFDRQLYLLSATLLGALRGIALPQHLILVPDGALHRVPFAALWLPGPKLPLGAVHDLVQVPGAGYLLAGREPKPVRSFPKTMLALVDPVFAPDDPRIDERLRRPADAGDAGAKLARLPFTAELDTVTKLVAASRVTILRGFEASTKALQDAPAEKFAVIYFSTHAFIDDRIPEISRIALSMVSREGRPLTGFLRPYQMSGLHLNGSIVVLSACDTALGKQVLGEGLAGVSSSLFAAGAAQLVLSLNKADAPASSAFFAAVYGKYLGPHPVSMDHALTLVRQKFLQSENWADPYYWASFVVVGRPARVL